MDSQHFRKTWPSTTWKIAVQGEIFFFLVIRYHSSPVDVCTHLSCAQKVTSNKYKLPTTSCGTRFFASDKNQFEWCWAWVELKIIFSGKRHGRTLRSYDMRQYWFTHSSRCSKIRFLVDAYVWFECQKGTDSLKIISVELMMSLCLLSLPLRMPLLWDVCRYSDRWNVWMTLFRRMLIELREQLKESDRRNSHVPRNNCLVPSQCAFSMWQLKRK